MDLAGPHAVIESGLLLPTLVGGPGGALGLAHHGELGCLAPTMVLDDVAHEELHPALDAAEGVEGVVVGVERAWPGLALGAAPGVTFDLAQCPFPGARNPYWYRAVVGIVL